MQKCKVCGGNDFYKDAGYFFCVTCQTQNEDVREEVFELRYDPMTRLRKTRIKRTRSEKSGEELGWTTWELYNFVLIGLTNELIELGVPAEIKLTILQLWATYLGKIEVAFTSTRKKCVPRLARKYNRRDAEIIYGKVQAQKRSRKRRRTGSSTNTSMFSDFQSEGSSFRELNKSKRLMVNAEYDRYLQSQASTEGDAVSSFSQSLYSVQSSSVKSSDNEGKIQYSSHAKDEINKIKSMSKKIPRSKRARYKEKHTSTQYKIGPSIITPMRLWAILYIALRLHNQPIHLGDMLRYGREGHLSYYKLDHLLPPEVTLTKSDINFLSQSVEITHKGMRRIVASMAKFLGVSDLICPDLVPLINRYCQELGLPRGILLYTERLIALSPPKMRFDEKKSCIPNYEGRAMAFIIIVLKILFALDGITEYQISRVAERISGVAIERGLLDTKLFDFQEWQKYIECRKTILVHSHFPTKLKYCSDTHGIDGLYMKFLDFINSKGERTEPEVTTQKNCLPEDLVDAMRKHIYNLSDNDMSPKEIDIFPPSLTPLHSYLQQLLSDPLNTLPRILQNDFFFTKVGYMTKPYSLLELAKQCEIELDIIDTNLHFLEKFVPPFEQARLPSIDELKEPVEVQDETNADEKQIGKIESFSDYVQRKIPCKMNLNVKTEQYYDHVTNSMSDFRNSKLGSDFAFTEVLPDGRLAIPNDSDSEVDDKEIILRNVTDNAKTEKLLAPKFCEKYNLRLLHTERESIVRPETTRRARFKRRIKLEPERNSKGHFIKSEDEASVKIEDNESEDDPFSTINNFIEEEFNEIQNDKSLMADDVDIDGALGNLTEVFNLSQISLLCEDETDIKTEVKLTGKLQFCRPFKDYWMYHCIFSRVKPKNFEVFEKSLPISFRWLLHECAHIVEMTEEDLYEEVCLIESFHAYIVKSSSTQEAKNMTNLRSKIQQNLILSKW